MVFERAYAKINLTLDVLYKRPDRFHEVNMVMQTVDLSDLIWIEETEGSDIVVESTVSHIPLDSRNLVAVATRVFQEYSGITKSVRIKIDKNIPVAAGLGGGSSDAAAVLRALNRLWGTGYSVEQLASIGASIGSDVPFCVYGGAAIASGRGEKIERVFHNLKAWVVLVRPPVFVSTADIYQSLLAEDFASQIHSGPMVEALVNSSLDEVVERICNDLAPKTFALYPEVPDMLARFENVANSPVFMSGSGPTLFALFRTHSAATRVVNALRGFTKEVYLCRMV